MTITINDFLTKLEPTDLKIHLNTIADKHTETIFNVAITTVSEFYSNSNIYKKRTILKQICIIDSFQCTFQFNTNALKIKLN
jgi:hypothetical protein